MCYLIIERISVQSEKNPCNPRFLDSIINTCYHTKAHSSIDGRPELLALLEFRASPQFKVKGACPKPERSEWFREESPNTILPRLTGWIVGNANRWHREVPSRTSATENMSNRGLKG